MFDMPKLHRLGEEVRGLGSAEYAVNASIAAHAFAYMQHRAEAKDADPVLRDWWVDWKDTLVWQYRSKGAGSRCAFSKSQNVSVKPVLQAFKDKLFPLMAFEVSTLVSRYLFAGVLLDRYPQLLRIHAPPSVTFRWTDTLGGTNRAPIYSQIVRAPIINY